MRVIHEASLSEVYSRLHATFQLLARTGLGRDQLAASPAAILDLLLTHAHFDEARSFAVDSSMQHLLDDISLREAQHLLSRAKTGLWTVEQERMVRLETKSLCALTLHNNTTKELMETSGQHVQEN